MTKLFKITSIWSTPQVQNYNQMREQHHKRY